MHIIKEPRNVLVLPSLIVGLIRKPCVQWVQVSKREPEAWETTAYWLKIVDRDGQEHKILAFEVEKHHGKFGLCGCI